MAKYRDRPLTRESASPKHIRPNLLHPPRPWSVASMRTTRLLVAHRDHSTVDPSFTRYNSSHPPHQQKSDRAPSLIAGNGDEEFGFRRQSRPAPCPFRNKIWSPLLHAKDSSVSVELKSWHDFITSKALKALMSVRVIMLENELGGPNRLLSEPLER
ncbi:hypothetical protein BHM03_00021897 [Ensete ventricosum]|uniref:Uncharacterized protein n=1 Tax=Ensete ventricosum TaxID=4639 RepID=A0A445MG92_ENSVE|nr:hypothetical protein BHM03_00021897 [Ensete ventricosum]